MPFLKQLEGLPQEQCKALLKFDPVARFKHRGDHQGINDLVDAYVVDLSRALEFSDARIASFLRTCAEDFFDNQMRVLGYAFLCHADELDDGHSALDRAIERFEMGMLPSQYAEKASPAQLESMFERALKEVMDDHVEVCFERLANREEHAQRVLDYWIIRGNFQRATEVASRYLNRELSEDEKRRIAPAILLKNKEWTNAALTIAGKYAEYSLRRTFIDAQCRRHVGTWKQFRDLADLLRVKPEREHMRGLLAHTRLAFDKVAMVECEFRVHGLQADLELRYQLLPQARQEALNYSQIVSAEKFGNKIGQPLTPNELLAFIRQWSSSDAPEANNHKLFIPWATDLLLARLQDPSAPAPPAPEPE